MCLRIDVWTFGNGTSETADGHIANNAVFGTLADAVSSRNAFLSKDAGMLFHDNNLAGVAIIARANSGTKTVTSGVN